MNKAISMASAVLLVSITSGCATILNDDSQKVNITTSTGEKADLSVNGRKVTAPAVIDVPRSKNPLVIRSVDGKCADETIANNEVDTVFWINILTGGPFGSTTDYASEKMWRYDDSVEVSCKK